MNLEVKDRIDLVRKAVDARRRFRREETGSKVIRAEENVCVQSRALYSKFIDTWLWRGGFDAQAVDLVREVLNAASQCLTADGNCRRAVETRLREFEQFCASESVPAER